MEMSLTVKDKKSVILFSTEELFILKEALDSHPFYDETMKKQIYDQYGMHIGDNHDEKQTKLREKMEKIFEASRVWDFEGFEYR